MNGEMEFSLAPRAHIYSAAADDELVYSLARKYSQTVAAKRLRGVSSMMLMSL